MLPPISLYCTSYLTCIEKVEGKYGQGYKCASHIAKFFVKTTILFLQCTERQHEVACMLMCHVDVHPRKHIQQCLHMMALYLFVFFAIMVNTGYCHPHAYMRTITNPTACVQKERFALMKGYIKTRDIHFD